MPLKIRSDSTRWGEIEADFNRPVKALVEDWRRNSTWRTIAKALGVCERTLRRWRKQWGMEIGGERKTDEFSFPESRVDKRARELGFANAADLIRCYKLAPHCMTDTQIAKILRCSMMTIYRHKPVEIVGIQNLSDEGREKLRQCGIKSGGRPAANHPWKGRQIDVENHP